MDADADDGTARRIALIEVEGRDGRVARTVDVRRWPLTIGRAIDNVVVVDDPHVAGHHLRIEQAGSTADVAASSPSPAAAGGNGREAPVLVVLDTRNGVRMGGQRLPAGSSAALPAGGCALTLGTTTLRLRLPGEVLAPERELAPEARLTARQLALTALALAAVVWGGHWAALDPGADYSAWLPALVGLPLALAAWCGAWALMSKLFQHRFDFAGHLRAALPWLLASAACEMLWPQLAAALGLRWLWQLGPPLQALVLALLVRAQLRLLLPAHPKAVTAAVVALLVVGGGISLALTRRTTDSFAAAPYMSTLPLPALRLAGTDPSRRLVDDIGPLAERLAKRVEQARRDDAEGDDDGD